VIIQKWQIASDFMVDAGFELQAYRVTVEDSNLALKVEIG
jgi:hypothetical protein